MSPFCFSNVRSPYSLIMCSVVYYPKDYSYYSFIFSSYLTTSTCVKTSPVSLFSRDFSPVSLTLHFLFLLIQYVSLLFKSVSLVVFVSRTRTSQPSCCVRVTPTFTHSVPPRYPLLQTLIRREHTGQPVPFLKPKRRFTFINYSKFVPISLLLLPLERLAPPN